MARFRSIIWLVLFFRLLPVGLSIFLPAGAIAAVKLPLTNSGYAGTRYTYDTRGRLTVQTDANGNTSYMIYTNTLPASTFDPAGTETDCLYDPAGNLIETVYPDGSVTRTTYDEKNRAVYTQDRSLVDGGSNTVATASVNVYDAAGRVICVERRSAVKLKVTTTTTGFVALAGADTQYAVTMPSAGTRASFTRTVFDLGGRVQYAMDARGTVTEYRYDAADRRTNTLVYTNYSVSLSDVNAAIAPGTNGAMKTISLYDPNGNQVAVIDNLGRTNVYQYDSANRLIETDYPAVAGDALHLTLTDYDGAGRKIREMDEAGVWTAYSYDFRGLLTSVVQDYGRPDALITTYGYDLLGNLISQVDANNGTDGNSHTTSFLYDQLGRRTVRILPGGQTETNSYDAVGNLAIYTSFNGVRFTNQYDAVNRLTSRASTNGYKVSYTYTATGQRQTMTDSTGTNKWIYDALNRMITNSSPVGTLIYGYDIAGSVTNIVSGTSNGANLGYLYDLLGRLTTVTAYTTNIASYVYDGVGNLAALAYANGVTNLYQYTAQNRLTNLQWKHGATSLAGFQYQLGMAGNRTNLAETVNGTTGSYAWTYDNLYRMTNEGINGNTIRYVLDNVGNRLNRNSSGVTLVTTTNNTFGSNDRLTSDTYDANGNTLASGGAASWYDVENRLTTYSNTTAITMTYNGDGMRVSKTVGGVTTTYLVDTINPTGYPQVLEERSGGSLSKVYAYGTALINQRQVSSGVVRYYGTDGHGSVRFLTDTSGSVSDTYTYDAFGIGIASTGSTANNYLYSGEQWDPDLGMYYLRARYYRPDTGRFWSMDTDEGNRSDPRSLNKYLYCMATPINGFDPTGHDMSWESYFGYEAEEAIDDEYEATHPLDLVAYGNQQPTGSSFLKPDIFNTTKKKFMEIKPISTAGVVKGLAKMTANEAAFGPLTLGFSPDLSWKPRSSLLHTTDSIIFVINVGGIAFYKDINEIRWELITAASITSARQLLPYLKFTYADVGPAIARITRLALSVPVADEADEEVGGLSGGLIGL